MLAPAKTRVRAVLGALLAGVLLTAVAPGVANAGPGYELDSVKPSIPLAGELPHGVAVDQSSQALYVAELTTDFFNAGHGQIEQFSSTGVPTANSPFLTGGEDFFTGVAVNPTTNGIYAYQTQLSTPFGVKGAPQMSSFSSTGVSGASFSPTKSTAAQPAADSAGRILFPNDTSDTVQILSSTGTVEGTVACGGCTGGAFIQPQAAAVDGAGNLYVADIGGGGRVVKFSPSGGSYAYASVLQSGEGAVAVGVDPSSNDVFVGDYTEGTYHVVAYDSAGTQFDDFGGGVVGPPSYGIETSGQVAVNATTHKVYVSDPSGNELWVFDRVGSIPAPAATTSPATSPGQLEATLQASVNPKAHGLLDCHFEYTDHADFQLHGFANATDAPCPFKPTGSTSAPMMRTVTGLIPGTAYDYRIVATTNGGTAEGAAEEFETLPPLAPTVASGAASSLTQTTATLAGSVNPQGGPISDCHFEYTSKADFELNIFANALSEECEVIPEGTTSEAVSAKVSGLSAGTDYRFRVVATNNSGTGEGTPQPFTTLADTCATNPMLCPPPPEEKHEAPRPPVVVPTPAPTSPAAPPAKPLKCHKGFKKKTVHGKRKCVKVKKRKRRHR